MATQETQQDLVIKVLYEGERHSVHYSQDSAEALRSPIIEGLTPVITFDGNTFNLSKEIYSVYNYGGSTIHLSKFVRGTRNGGSNYESMGFAQRFEVHPIKATIGSENIEAVDRAVQLLISQGYVERGER